MYVKVKNIIKNINKDKLFTIVIVVFIILYLIVNNKKDIFEQLIHGTQMISYTKTEYVLTKCEEYLNDQNYIKEEGRTYCISLKQLKNANYISGAVRNPNTLELLPDSYTIEAKYINGKYELRFNNYCN